MDDDIMRMLVEAGQVRRHAIRGLVIGLAIAAVAGLITLATYASAQDQAAQTGEGHYYVLWGGIVFGLLRAGRAARVLFKLRGLPRL